MINHPDIEQYLSEMAPVSNPILTEMEKLAAERNLPIAGPLVGRLLVSLIKFGHVHTVLECGSGFGYSTMWMALALSENARITCIDYSEANIEEAKIHFEKAGFLHKVTFLQGDVGDIIPELTETYDLIVNDVDKRQYPEFLPYYIERIRVGGMLVSNNILVGGKVPLPAQDAATAALQQFNQMLIKEPSLWNSFLPLRDGISMSIKLKV